jgi:PAS domain S-box-containing protein
MTPEFSAEQVAGHALRSIRLSVVLTDPRLPENPITYVNDAFQALTLYSREYALGRNCRFLQGPKTNPRDVERIRKGLEAEDEFQVTITNHRADGTAFRNQLLIAPVRGPSGELTAFFAVQREVGEDTADLARPDDETLILLRELQHRVKNHLAMVVSMIRIQAKRDITPNSLKAVSRRVEALVLLYEELFAGATYGGSNGHIAAGAYVSRVASVVSGLEPRRAIRVNVECDEISLPVEQAARLGLLLSEFLTNALEHAFKSRAGGVVEVRFRRLRSGAVRLSVEDDGVGMPEGSNWPYSAPSLEAQHDRAEHDQGRLDTTGHGREPGVGGSIAAALTQSIGGTLHVASSKHGTIITVDFHPGE